MFNSLIKRLRSATKQSHIDSFKQFQQFFLDLEDMTSIIRTEREASCLVAAQAGHYFLEVAQEDFLSREWALVSTLNTHFDFLLVEFRRNARRINYGWQSICVGNTNVFLDAWVYGSKKEILFGGRNVRIKITFEGNIAKIKYSWN